MAAVTIA